VKRRAVDAIHGGGDLRSGQSQKFAAPRGLTVGNTDRDSVNDLLGKPSMPRSYLGPRSRISTCTRHRRLPLEQFARAMLQGKALLRGLWPRHQQIVTDAQQLSNDG
jgi:hypothetical protein